MPADIPFNFKHYARNHPGLDGRLQRVALAGDAVGDVQLRQRLGITAQGLEAGEQSGGDISSVILPVLAGKVDGEGGSEVEHYAGFPLEQIAHGKQRGGTVVGQIVGQIVALEYVVVGAVQYHQMAALLLERGLLLGGDGLGRNHRHNLGFFLFGEGEYELHHFLPLETESFAEGHSLGPGGLEGRISDFYQQICHFAFSSKVCKDKNLS